MLYVQLGRFDEAAHALAAALSVRHTLSDTAGESIALIGLGFLRIHQGFYAEALACNMAGFLAFPTPLSPPFPSPFTFCPSTQFTSQVQHGVGQEPHLVPQTMVRHGEGRTVTLRSSRRCELPINHDRSPGEGEAEKVYG